MSNPLLSIITVVYNGGATLEDTIRSVGDQTYTDREYIVVDGGSSDGTIGIIKKYTGSVVSSWVSEPDKGIYDAMNKGIRMARGEWIFFLGSDDTFIHANVLTEFFARSLTDIDLAYGDVHSEGYSGRYDGEFSFRKLLSKNLSHQAAFYRRSLFDRLGTYDLRYRMHADWEFNLRCFSDSRVRTSYTGVLVANFGVGGVSSRHDVLFLLERLIPARLNALKQGASYPLRRLGYFDEWWRSLRNARIISAQELAATTADPLPRAIRRMIRWQRLVPKGLLRFGPFSKTWMFICYVFSGLTGDL